MSNPAAPLKRLPVTPAVAGWPRPRAKYIDGSTGAEEEVQILPVPWVLETHDEVVAWTTFNRESHRAHLERLCQVCGEQLGRTLLLGNAEEGGEPMTSGPGCHPRCMALALSFCPHFKDCDEAEAVAFAYQGSGVGYVIEYDSDQDAPSAEDIALAYMSSMRIVRHVKPLNQRQVKELARRDPFGDDPELEVVDFLVPSGATRAEKSAIAVEEADGTLKLQVREHTSPVYCAP